MFYTLLTLVALCSAAETKVEGTRPTIKPQTTVIEKFINIPKQFKVSNKVKYNKVPTRWERS